MLFSNNKPPIQGAKPEGISKPDFGIAATRKNITTSKAGLPEKQDSGIYNKVGVPGKPDYGIANARKIIPTLKSDLAKNQNLGVFRGIGAREQKKPVPVAQKPAVSSDSSIFHGKAEISRSEFRADLKKNYEGSRMNISERLKIEKRDLPSFYGPNISKSDLRSSVNKLNKKLSISLTKPEERVQIRKDIKYIKKIGKF